MEMSVISQYIFDRKAGLEVVVSHGRKAAFSPHTHISAVTVILVREGVICLNCCAGEQVLTDECVAIVPPHTRHSIIAPKKYSMVSLCIGCTLFASGVRYENYNRIDYFLALLVSSGVLHPEEKIRFIDLLRTAEIHWESTNDVISQLRRNIEAHPEQEVTLDEMAGTVHLDKGHLIRCFKKRFGMTPHGFLAQCRVRKARRDFMGNMSLTQAAYLAGFYDQSHFIRHFKKMHCITPRDYLSACRSVIL